MTSTPAPTRPYSEIGAPRAVSDEGSAHAVSLLPPRRGDHVGRYVVDRRLGHGGMGVVFGARDPELGRQVAIKLVRQRAGERPDPRFSTRLRREAQALARLAHPNIVTLYDLGLTRWGIFLAMEFVHGYDLSTWLKDRSRPWQQVLDVFVQAGRGLAAAHDAGIMHRDFKPTNAIVGPGGHVTVVDFGLARATEDNEPEPRGPDDSSPDLTLLTRRLTKANMVLGTRGYMAPEQMLGLPVGAACDQFAFCVTFYEALYGQRPYPGENAIETARAYADGDLVLPPRGTTVPAWLFEVLRKGLAVEPQARHADMHALLAQLTRPRGRTGRRVLLAAAFVATAAVASIATSWWHLQRNVVPAPAADIVR